MIELPDDELDKLFRKSSEELDPTFDPEDWNNLRKRLDQQDGRTPAGWWRKWWPLGVLALLIPAGIVLYSFYGEEGGKVISVRGKNGGKGEGRKDESGVVAEGKEAVIDNENETNSKNESETNAKKDIGNKLITSKKETGKSSSESDLNAVTIKDSKILPRSRSKAGGVYLEPNRSKVEGGDGAFSINKNADRAGKKGKGKTGSGSNVALNTTTSIPAAGIRQQNGEAKPIQPGTQQSVERDNTQIVPVQSGMDGAAQQADRVAEVEERLLIAASALAIRPLTWRKAVLPDVIAPVQEAAKVESTLEEPKMPVDQPKWAIRFGYSPDLSTVGLKNFSKPGSAVSLLVEYALIPRLYLQSGAIWSRKDYRALAESYQFSDRWGYYPKPESIDGICDVLEVPLNLRYDLFSGQRSRWFVGTGFSSYYMLKEKYDYNYRNPDDPRIKWWGWADKTTSWYLLSHLNASAGYEYRFSKKLSLLAEPYVRVPLKKVGYGKVNLFTTGIWLSVRYTPVFK